MCGAIDDVSSTKNTKLEKTSDMFEVKLPATYIGSDYENVRNISVFACP